MKVGDILRGRVESLTIDGNGFLRIDEKDRFYSCFIPKSIPGELVEFKIEEIKRFTIRCSLIKVIEPSKYRSYEEDIPGFDLLHITYEGQLKFKKQMLKNIFKDYEVQDIIESSIPYRDRAKLRLEKKKTFKLGFRKEKSHEIFDIEECRFLLPGINSAIKELRSFFIDYKGDIEAEIDLRLNHANSKVVVSVKKDSFEKGLIEKLRELLDISDCMQDIILISDKIVTFGNRHAVEYVNSGCLMQASHLSFTQVNLEINNKITEFIKKEIAARRNESLVDLYCGNGNFSVPLSKLFGEVLGIDENKSAITDAEENAQVNNCKNAEFLAFDVCKKVRETKRRFEKAIIDPPRAGLEDCAKHIKKIGAKKIIYISCNPRSLLYDLGQLEGYEVEKIQPFDMFPYTSHIEVAVVLKQSLL